MISKVETNANPLGQALVVPRDKEKQEALLWIDFRLTK